MRNQPITAVIVGAGHRAFVYSKLALTDPDKLKIVGVADPDKIRWASPVRASPPA